MTDPGAATDRPDLGTVPPPMPDEPTSPAGRRSWHTATWLPGAAAMVTAGVVLFPSPGRDDAYITFWSARALSRTGEILNYSGDRLEQSSSLLHVLVLALADLALPVSLPTLGWLVGLLAGIGAVAMAAVGAERAAPGSGVLAGTLTATSAHLLYWSLGGLETSLAALALVALVVTFGAVWTDGTRTAWLAFAAAALAQVLVRPEGALVAGAVLAGAAGAAAVGPRLRVLDAGLVRDHAPDGRSPLAPRLLAAGAIVAAAYAAISALRWWYFGSPVPQPVRAKVGGLRIEEGLRYLERWLVDRPAGGLALVAALAAAVALRRIARPEPLLALLATVAIVGATATSGGDWMEAGRMLAPAAPCVALVTAVGVHRLLEGRVLAAAAVAVVAVNVVGVLHVARSDSTTQPIWSSVVGDVVADLDDDLPYVERANRVHVRDAAFIPVLAAAVEQVADHVTGPVRIASGQAGMVPFHVVGGTDVPIEFIDIGSLASDRFGACRELLTRSSLGNAISYDRWFTHPDRCGVELPHLVYGLGAAGAVEAGPYVEVHRQRGDIVSDSDLLPGTPVEAALYLAVHRDLVDVVTGRAGDG